MSEASDVKTDHSEAPTGKVLAFEAPHAFAAFLRTIGRGSTVGRPLDENEAEAAFDMILDGAIEPLRCSGPTRTWLRRLKTPHVRGAASPPVRRRRNGRGRPERPSDS